MVGREVDRTKKKDGPESKESISAVERRKYLAIWVKIPKNNSLANLNFIIR